MATIAQILQNLKALDLHDVVMQALEETTPDMQALNISQLQKGKLRDDTTITNVKTGNKAYSSRHKKYRQGLGLQVDHVDLKITGQFYNEINFKLSNTEIEIDSTVPYSKYIEEMYTPQVFGLTPENRREYIFNKFFNVLKPKIESVTKLTFK